VEGTSDAVNDPETEANTTVTSSSNDALNKSSGIMGIDPYVALGGGLALFGMAGTMLKHPKTYPAEDAKDPNWPKGGLLGYQQFPSEQALKKMVA
jgi:hypothetical protein